MGSDADAITKSGADPFTAGGTCLPLPGLLSCHWLVAFAFLTLKSGPLGWKGLCGPRSRGQEIPRPVGLWVSSCGYWAAGLTPEVTVVVRVLPISLGVLCYLKTLAGSAWIGEKTLSVSCPRSIGKR